MLPVWDIEEAMDIPAQRQLSSDQDWKLLAQTESSTQHIIILIISGVKKKCVFECLLVSWPKDQRDSLSLAQELNIVMLVNPFNCQCSNVLSPLGLCRQVCLLKPVDSLVK